MHKDVVQYLMKTPKVLSVKVGDGPTDIRVCATPADLTANLREFGLLPHQVEWVQRVDRPGRYMTYFPGGRASIVDPL